MPPPPQTRTHKYKWFVVNSKQNKTGAALFLTFTSGCFFVSGENLWTLKLIKAVNFIISDEMHLIPQAVLNSNTLFFKLRIIIYVKKQHNHS